MKLHRARRWHLQDVRVLSGSNQRGASPGQAGGIPGLLQVGSQAKMAGDRAAVCWCISAAAVRQEQSAGAVGRTVCVRSQTGSGIGPEYVSPKEVVARIAKFPIKNEPGVKFDYQTSGYNPLGAAIEEVSGKSFGNYLQENLWSPMGMKDTRMDNVREVIPNRVRGYGYQAKFSFTPWLQPGEKRTAYFP